MSRLQVGGLALIIKPWENMNNVGKVVELIEHTGDFLNFGDCWFIRCQEGLDTNTGICQKESNVQTWRLMPLGDDQTQAEFRKELNELVF